MCGSAQSTAQLAHACPCVCAMYLAALNLRITDPHTGRSTHVALGGGTCICTRGPAPWILRESQSVWMTAATHDGRCTLRKFNKGNEADLSMRRMRRSGNLNGRSPHILNSEAAAEKVKANRRDVFDFQVWHTHASCGAGGAMAQRLSTMSCVSAPNPPSLRHVWQFCCASPPGLGP